MKDKILIIPYDEYQSLLSEIAKLKSALHQACTLLEETKVKTNSNSGIIQTRKEWKEHLLNETN